MNNSSFNELKTIFIELLNKVAPLKTKYLRANYCQFMTKELSKVILRRTKLRNQFLKKRTLEAKLKYNKQRNLCVNMHRKAIRNHYENLVLNDINDNKKLWTTVKPLFCSKVKSAENITQDENGELVKMKRKLQIFLMIFCKHSPKLGINTNMISFLLQTFQSNYDPIENTVCQYENHPHAIAIKKHVKVTNSSFSFQTVTKENIAKLITNLDIKKAVQSMHILTS